MDNKVSVTIGWSFFIAGFISYILNGFWWSVVHAFCGWIYLIYVIIFRHSELIPAFKTYFGI